MVARIFITIALVILAASFIWFTGMMMWLGLKEFFRLRSKHALVDKADEDESSRFCPSKPEI